MIDFIKRKKEIKCEACRNLAGLRLCCSQTLTTGFITSMPGNHSLTSYLAELIEYDLTYCTFLDQVLFFHLESFLTHRNAAIYPM